MFAIPGIIGLLFFIYVRPQEAVESLQSVPFLHLFFGLACLGLAVDLRLRISKAVAVPHLPWALALYFWAVIGAAIAAPGSLLDVMIVFGMSVATFVLIAQGLQTFRSLELVAAVVLLMALILSLIGSHQATAPRGCVKAPAQTRGLSDRLGTPDGRSCERPIECYRGDPEPGANYWCERVGLLGTHAINDRVRYRGVLQDPNELALAIGAGLALGLALAFRRRNARWRLLTGFALVVGAVCIYYTRSRSGQLVLLSVLGIFALWRYRWKAVAAMVPVAIPAMLLVLGGGGRSDAARSTEERFEAWRAGIDMLKSSPVFGIGQAQYTEHHYLTAHNTFVLAMAELGLVGLFLFTMLFYVAVKTPAVALHRYWNRDEASVARVWAVGLLASFAAIVAGASFLSFAYHFIMWIYLGLSGAFFVCVKRHDPEFKVRIGFVDMVAVVIADGVILVLIDLYLRLKHF